MFDAILNRQTKETLGEVIDRARIQAGYSQQELAGAIGVTQSALSKFTHNVSRSISHERIVHMCELIYLDPHYVYFLSGAIHPDIVDAMLADWETYTIARANIGL